MGPLATRPAIFFSALRAEAEGDEAAAEGGDDRHEAVHRTKGKLSEFRIERLDMSYPEKQQRTTTSNQKLSC